MVKNTIGKIKDAEGKGEKLIKEAEADFQARVSDFQKGREKRLRQLEAENLGLKAKIMGEAEEKAKAEESKILSDAQKEMNSLRASADKNKEAAISLIIEKIFEN